MKYEVEGYGSCTIKNYEIKGKKIIIYFVDKNVEPKVVKFKTRDEMIEAIRKVKASMLEQLSSYVNNTKPEDLSGKKARDYSRYKFYYINEDLFNDANNFRQCKIYRGSIFKLKRVKVISPNDVDKFSKRKLIRIKKQVNSNRAASDYINEVCKGR